MLHLRLRHVLVAVKECVVVAAVNEMPLLASCNCLEATGDWLSIVRALLRIPAEMKPSGAEPVSLG